MLSSGSRWGRQFANVARLLQQILLLTCQLGCRLTYGFSERSAVVLTQLQQALGKQIFVGHRGGSVRSRIRSDGQLQQLVLLAPDFVLQGSGAAVIRGRSEAWLADSGGCCNDRLRRVGGWRGSHGRGRTCRRVRQGHGGGGRTGSGGASIGQRPIIHNGVDQFSRVGSAPAFCCAQRCQSGTAGRRGQKQGNRGDGHG